MEKPCDACTGDPNGDGIPEDGTLCWRCEATLDMPRPSCGVLECARPEGPMFRVGRWEIVLDDKDEPTTVAFYVCWHCGHEKELDLWDWTTSEHQRSKIREWDLNGSGSLEKQNGTTALNGNGSLGKQNAIPKELLLEWSGD